MQDKPILEIFRTTWNLEFQMILYFKQLAKWVNLYGKYSYSNIIS